MVKVFSFYLCNDNEEQCFGMLENLKSINFKFPEFETWIYISDNVPKCYVNKFKEYKVKIILTKENIKIERLFPIDNPEVEVMFCRNVDGRINERDEWCIKDFLQSNESFHIIRDNYLHKKHKVIPELMGIKKGILPSFIKKLYDLKQSINDIDFINKIIYPLFKKHILIHSDIIRFKDEQIKPIISLLTNTNFIGNLYGYNSTTGLEYPKLDFYNQLNRYMIEHLNWLKNEKSWNEMINIWEKYLTLANFLSQDRYIILDNIYMAYYYTRQYVKCREVLAHFDFTYVNEHIIHNSNYLFDKLRNVLGFKIIATTDHNREPNTDKEIVIVYGNFHHSVDTLPVINKIYRHAIYYWDIQHDITESDSCWINIDQIYILNLIERKDRFMEMMVELTRLNAPLDRIYHYHAIKEKVTGKKTVDPHLGALKTHTKAVEDFINHTEYNHVLILEDDVTITPQIKQHKNDLTDFFDRKYDFDICMITASKYWEIKPYDDLLYLSYQICTTASGYILSRQGGNKILPLFKESYDKLAETGDTITYAADRYWAKIQKDNKFFLFKNKWGYQRCGYSSITGVVDCHFD